MKNIFLAILFIFSGIALATPEIPNFSQVSRTIYRGGRPGDDGLKYLSSNFAIKTDIDLQGGDIQWDEPAIAAFMSWWEPGETEEAIAAERQLAEEVLNMDFVSAPLNSVAEVTPQEDATIDRILDIMADPSRHPIYLHCEHGVDRTGLIVALYRVKYEAVPIERAHAEWVALGHSGMSAFFTGNLDTYFYTKAKRIRGGTPGA